MVPMYLTNMRSLQKLSALCSVILYIIAKALNGNSRQLHPQPIFKGLCMSEFQIGFGVVSNSIPDRVWSSVQLHESETHLYLKSWKTPLHIFFHSAPLRMSNGIALIGNVCDFHNFRNC